MTALYKYTVDIDIDRGCYGTLLGRHMCPVNPCQFRWPGGTQVAIFFGRMYARMVWLNDGMVTHLGRAHVCRPSVTLPSQGAGPQRPQIFGTSYTYTDRVWQILCVQTRWEENFDMVPHEYFCERMLTRDLFVVANLFVYADCDS